MINLRILARPYFQANPFDKQCRACTPWLDVCLVPTISTLSVADVAYGRLRMILVWSLRVKRWLRFAEGRIDSQMGCCHASIWQSFAIDLVTVPFGVGSWWLRPSCFWGLELAEFKHNRGNQDLEKDILFYKYFCLRTESFISSFPGRFWKMIQKLGEDKGFFRVFPIFLPPLRRSKNSLATDFADAKMVVSEQTAS